MKLLQKSEIDKAKALDRQREINEGTKLARRVDSLRQIQAEEEASLNKFRIATIKGIKEETAALEKVKVSLETEVVDLEKRKKEALIPLTEEQERLQERRTELEDYDQALRDIGSDLEEKDSHLARRERELVIEEQRIAVEKERTTKLLMRADETAEEARRTLLMINNDKQLLKMTLEEADKEVHHRLAQVTSKEKGMARREEEIRKAEAELVKGWKNLKDREETFKRTIKRK